TACAQWAGNRESRTRKPVGLSCQNHGRPEWTRTHRPSSVSRSAVKVENAPSVHGIAAAPKLGRGFVSNGQAATVTIFDLKTLKKITDVPTGKKPDAILFDPATSLVFAFNGASRTRSALRARLEV